MEEEANHPFSFSRRNFIKQSSLASFVFMMPGSFRNFNNYEMKDMTKYDVVIVGGSYSGLAAAMALGRALRTVLVIDNGKPCNIQTPESHNFLTQDGFSPKYIAAIAREQVQIYDTVSFKEDTVTAISKANNAFVVQTQSNESIQALKIVFASGIKDEMPLIEGFAECWGISILHCPYCHGYEVKGLKTGILGNGELGFELAKLISNWTKNITIYTNGSAKFSPYHLEMFKNKNITIDERVISKIDHSNGCVNHLVFSNNSMDAVNAIYTRLPFTQNSSFLEDLGCDFTEEGYIKVDAQQRTSVAGIYASGDSTSKMRTVANAVSSGTTAGMMLNKEIIEERF